MKTSNIVPKLRFPEFSGEWEIKELGEIADRVYQKNSNYKVEKVLTNSALEGVVEQSSFFEGKITTKGNLDNYFVLDVGDFVYNPRISKLAPVGPISRNNIEKGIVSPLYFVFRFKNSYTDYYDYYFRTLLWHAYIKDNANKGARFDRISISAEKFMGLPIPYPSQQEQQKIADCLASFDELLDLEEKKLSALQKYKKGLLQKLFPQGESRIPEWRFPEFQNSGEWEIKELRELAQKISQRNYNTNIQRILTNSAIEGVIEQSRFFDREITTKSNLENYFILEQGDFVYNPRISSNAPVGPISRNNLCKGVISPLYFIFRFNNDYTDFYNYYFSTNLWCSYIKEKSNQGARFDRVNISIENFMKLPIFNPSLKEQQKIADFLSGVDELIEKQQLKIEQLKQHKKGLLQGLFPNIQLG